MSLDIERIRAYCERIARNPDAMLRAAQFYDHACTDLPAAIAEIERLREELAKVNGHDPDVCGCEDHAAWCPFNPNATELRNEQGANECD